MVKNLSELQVACRNPECAWHGKLGAYKNHHCPHPVEKIATVMELQEVVFMDERLDMKIACLKVIGKKVLNPRNCEVNRIYLDLVLAYMKRYAECEQIQNVCVDILLSVCEHPRGSLCLRDCSREFVDHLHSLLRVADLEEKVRKIVDIYMMASEPEVLTAASELVWITKYK